MLISYMSEANPQLRIKVIILYRLLETQ